MAAVREARTQPVRLTEKMTSKGACPRAGQIMRERHRPAWVLIQRRNPGQPGLHHPRQRVARAGRADRYRLGRGKPGTPGQLARRSRLRLELPPCRGGITRPQREPGRELVSDAEDGADRAR